jgi:hypothetical protein
VENLAHIVKNILFNLSNGNFSQRLHLRQDDAYPDIMAAINGYIDIKRRHLMTDETDDDFKSEEQVPSGP